MEYGIVIFAGREVCGAVEEYRAVAKKIGAVAEMASHQANGQTVVEICLTSPLSMREVGRIFWDHAREADSSAGVSVFPDWEGYRDSVKWQESHA